MSEAADGPMHIALAGPMTLSMLQPWFDRPITTSGFAFPGTSELALRYRAAGHRLTLVTTATDIGRAQRYEGDGVALVVLPARGRGKGRAFSLFHRERVAIRGAIDAARPDVVHAHWTYEFGLAARAAAAPSLVTVHDWAPAIARFNRHPYWYFRWVMQVLCLLQRGPLTAPSAYVADRVRRWYRRPCTVVANGIDLTAYAPGPRSSGPRVLMLNVGFSDRKNVAAALRAWPAVLRRVPEALLVLGGPDYEPEGPAASWAAEHGLTTGVEFRGPLDPSEVPAWMSSGAVFLHTSKEESFGLVLVEAMASGLPVVVGAGAGAAPAVVGAGGVAVDLAALDVVAETVADLLLDDDLARRFAEQGATIAARYDARAVTEAYLALLRAAASAHARRAPA